MHIFRHIFLSNYWGQRSDIWSQASYRYPISWEAFFDPSDSYFLFAEEREFHKWALAHSSSCLSLFIFGIWFLHLFKTKTIQMKLNLYYNGMFVLWPFNVAVSVQEQLTDMCLQLNSTLYQNAVFWLVDERGIFYQFSVFSAFPPLPGYLPKNIPVL
jgi:hypothetical protein